ncbi:hypothetical protein PLICRDRAFT_702386, partial [Plicaturopsis crispa FD-325 SS-3]
MSSAKPALVSVELDTTLGAVEIGIILSLCLFGTVNAQVYTYFRKFPEDKTWLKMWASSTQFISHVVILWICALAYTSALSVVIYTMTVKSFGQPQKLLQAPVTFHVATLLGATIAAISQAFSARRIWLLSKKLYIPILCGIFSTANLSLAISMTVDNIQKRGTWAWLILARTPDFVAWLAVGAATDLIITVSLCYLIYNERSCAISRTIAVVDRLLLWTAQAGVMTRLADPASYIEKLIKYLTVSFSSMTALVLLTVLPENYAWLAVLACLPQLFIVSVLALLNARASLRRDLEDVVLMSTFRLPQAHTSGGDTHTRSGGGCHTDIKPKTMDSGLAVAMGNALTINLVPTIVAGTFRRQKVVSNEHARVESTQVQAARKCTGSVSKIVPQDACQ